jgi:hypothetical protein
MTPAQLSFISKVLQLAMIADLEYQTAKTNGTATLLQPGNFDSTLSMIATILAPAPAAVPLTGTTGIAGLQPNNQAIGLVGQGTNVAP